MGKLKEQLASTSMRYQEQALANWGDWDVIGINYRDDWDGHCAFLLEKDGVYVSYEWFYGSCSGCDSWESAGYSEKDVQAEMLDTALVMDADGLRRWAEMLRQSAAKSSWKTCSWFPTAAETLEWVEEALLKLRGE